MLDVVRAPRYSNPPINDDEWIAPELVEGKTTSVAQRRASAWSAGREVRQSQRNEERVTVGSVFSTFDDLEGDLQRAFVNAADPAHFQTAALMVVVDRLVADAERTVLTLARGGYQHAVDLGAAATMHAVASAGFTMHEAGPGVSVDFPWKGDPAVANLSFDNSVDLLSDAMRQFRTQISTSVRRVATFKDGFSDEMLKLARTIRAAGMDGAEFKAERIIRTELSRSFNTASFDKMAALGGRIEAMRKIWIRTGDSRTRQTHVAAGNTYGRGSGIPTSALFHVGAALLRFPVDPSGTGAGVARETIMCRCNNAVDFDELELGASTAQKISVAVGAPQRENPIAVAKDVYKGTSRSGGVYYFDKDGAAGVIARIGGTMEKTRRGYFVKNATGQKFGPDGWVTPETAAASVIPRGAPKPPKPFDAVKLREKVTKISTEGKAALRASVDEEQRLFGLYAAEQRKINLLQVKPGTLEHEEAVTKSREFSRAMAKQSATSETLRDKQRADTLKALAVPKADRTSYSWRYDGAPMTKRATARFEEARQAFESLVGLKTTGATFNGYKAGKITASIKDGNDRASAFNGQPLSIGHIVSASPSTASRVLVHELGHTLEYDDPRVLDAAIKFLEKRTAGETARKLSALVPGSSYADHEIAMEDKFLSTYMGKIYKTTDATKRQYATEIVSMGVEWLYAEPEHLAQDPEYFDFIVKLLRGIF